MDSGHSIGDDQCKVLLILYSKVNKRKDTSDHIPGGPEVRSDQTLLFNLYSFQKVFPRFEDIGQHETRIMTTIVEAKSRPFPDRVMC